MLTLGGGLKKRELLSARLGDVLSAIYLASCVLKHFENQGRRATDLPLVEWSVRTLMYEAQESLHAFLRNLPNRWVAALLRIFIFPRGRTYSAPGKPVMKNLIKERLAENAYTAREPGNPVGMLAEALELSEEVSPLEKRLRQAHKEGLIASDYLGRQIDEAESAEVVSSEEAARLRAYHEMVTALLEVDDFASEDLARRPAAAPDAPAPVSKAAKRKTPPRTKTAGNKASSKKQASKKKSPKAAKKKVAKSDGADKEQT